MTGLRLKEWVDRLRTIDDLDVHGVVTARLAQQNAHRDAAFVTYASDDAAPSEVIGTVRQEHTVGIEILLRVTNRRDRYGESGIAEMETLREKVDQKLLGWTPPTGADGPVTFSRGRKIAQDADGSQWWADEYRVPHLRSA